MFYCEPCRLKNEWPTSFAVSYGPCELCKKQADCYDRPSSSLPANRAERRPPSRVTLCGDPFDPAEKRVKDLETKQRRAITLSTLALLKRLEWAGEHGACLECRACPRCALAAQEIMTARSPERVRDIPQEKDLVKEHRDGCALKAEIDRFEKETT